MPSPREEPESSDRYFKLGDKALADGDLGNAVSYFRQVLALQPNRAEAHCKLGDAFSDLQQIADAVACYRRALEIDPGFVPAYYNLGTLLKDHRRYEDAIAFFRQAIALKPDFAESRFNLGFALQEVGQLTDAIDSYRRAIELRPDWSDAYCNLGFVLFANGQFDKADTVFKRALELNPDSAEAHTNWSFLLLLRGDFEQGWQEYEWRWKTRRLKRRQYDRPEWHGEPLVGKTILLHAEQGLGDTIQFLRFASLLKHRGASVVLECQPPLLKLLTSCPFISELVAYDQDLPPYDFYASLLSLPLKLRARIETIPCEIPYLTADGERVAEWSKKLGKANGFRIGINWHGRAGRYESRVRDLPLNVFRSLGQLPGVSLISLQKGGQKEIADAAEWLEIVDLGEFDTAHGAFMDTAAIMKNLDLIITSDTAVPHVAGALGVPVWLALPYVPNWRWLLNSSDTPWYPTMRLFRQKVPGDWDAVFSEMELALRNRQDA